MKELFYSMVYIQSICVCVYVHMRAHACVHDHVCSWHVPHIYDHQLGFICFLETMFFFTA